jgi:Kef-type K+ transport system membrane component KefB
MLNSIQLFGLVLLGGLAAGEAARRVLALPRTTGYVLFGLLTGQSGLNWITPFHIESAQLFIDLALGLILFELGYLVPGVSPQVGKQRLVAGLGLSLVPGLLMFALFSYWGFAAGAALFAAALCLATSAAITIATCSDVGAKGERSGLLYTMVAINGCVAFAAVMLLTPFLQMDETTGIVARIGSALGSIIASLLLGSLCAATVLLGVRKLERQPEHQHLLILGCIVLGVGTAVYLEASAFLPMLIFGVLVRAMDSGQKVIAIRIASDARVFLVITFVLAGAALDIAHLLNYWPEALVISAIRLLGQFVAAWFFRRPLGLSGRDSLLLGIGLQPMSSVALVLLANTQMLYAGLDPNLVGMLLATILLMQLCGPLATQTAIKGFGEASRLTPRRPTQSAASPAEQTGGPAS